MGLYIKWNVDNDNRLTIDYDVDLGGGLHWSKEGVSPTGGGGALHNVYLVPSGSAQIGSENHNLYVLRDTTLETLTGSPSASFYFRQENGTYIVRAVVSVGAQTYSDNFEYVLYLTDPYDENPVGAKQYNGILYDTGTFATISTGGSGGGSEGGEGDDPGTQETRPYQVWVTSSGSNENIATNGLLTRTYDGNPVVCKVYDPEHGIFINGSNFTWVVRDQDTGVIIGRSLGPTLSLTDTRSTVDVSAFYEDVLIDTVTITIDPINIPVSLKNGVGFSKYYDDRDGEGTYVVVTGDMFNYDLSGVLPEDKIDNNTLLETRLNIIPSATYTSAGSPTSTTTVGVNFSFGLTGSNSSNYTVTPDSTLQGVTGTILAKLNGKTADQNGYMMRVLDMASAAFVSDSSVPFNQQGYDVYVSKGSNPSGLSNANYEFSWICDFTKNNETTRSLSSPNNENICVDAGEYDVTVYVKGKTNSDDYSGGYAYVGQISLTILPVINVSWIACSYEG